MPAFISRWKSSVQTMLDPIQAADAGIYIVCNAAAVRNVEILSDQDVVGGRMEESAVSFFARHRSSARGELS
jgi:hypothetical protein